jgi:hypothetical protein
VRKIGGADGIGAVRSASKNKPEVSVVSHLSMCMYEYWQDSAILSSIEHSLHGYFHGVLSMPKNIVFGRSIGIADCP